MRTQVFLGLLFSGIYEAGIWFGFFRYIRNNYKT
jgi:hypothetical protein